MSTAERTPLSCLTFISRMREHLEWACYSTIGVLSTFEAGLWDPSIDFARLKMAFGHVAAVK